MKLRLQQFFVPNGFIIGWLIFNTTLFSIPLNYIIYNYINYPLIACINIIGLCMIRNVIVQLFIITFISSGKNISLKSTLIAGLLSCLRLTYFSNFYDLHGKQLQQSFNQVYLTRHQADMARMTDGLASKDFVIGTQGFFEIKDRLIEILNDWRTDFDLGKDCTIHRQTFNSTYQSIILPRLPHTFGTVRYTSLPEEGMQPTQYKNRLRTTTVFIQKLHEWREISVENYARVCKERYPNVKLAVLEYHCRHDIETFITPQIALELSLKDYDPQANALVNRRIQYPNVLN